MPDPMSFTVLVIWLLAAGMYPVGLMLGAPCSKCCGACPPGRQCSGGCCEPGQVCCDSDCCSGDCCPERNGPTCCSGGQICSNTTLVNVPHSPKCLECQCPPAICEIQVETNEPLGCGPHATSPCDDSAELNRTCYDNSGQLGGWDREEFDMATVTQDTTINIARTGEYAPALGPYLAYASANSFTNVLYEKPTEEGTIYAGGHASASAQLICKQQNDNIFLAEDMVLWCDHVSAVTTIGPLLSYKQWLIVLPSECLKTKYALCNGQPAKAKTPSYELPFTVEITDSGAKAVLADKEIFGTLMNYQPPLDDTVPERYRSFLEHIKDKHKFVCTFDKTQNYLCAVVACNCSVDVCFLVMEIRAYLDGPLVQWILCKSEEEQPRTREFPCLINDEEFTCIYKYETLSELKEGIIVDIHRFTYERYANPPDISGFPRERKVADLWCDKFGSAEGKDLWVMDFENICTKVDPATGFAGGFRYDRLMGEMECGPACGNDGSQRERGDPVPLGRAKAVYRLPGFPTSDLGDFECDQPLGGRLDANLRQSLSC